MAQIDRGAERRRLAKLYSGMKNEELQQIAAEADSLTDVAREALLAEFAARGMPPPTATSASNAKRVEPPEPVMVRRFRDLLEAELAKSILDSAGIQGFLAEENIVRLDWFYSNLVGGIKLLVREEDAEIAGKLLEQSVPEKFDVEGVGEYQQPRCPRCQSFDATFCGLNKRATYATLWLTGLPVPITKRNWKCHSCGHEWQDTDSSEASGPGRENGRDP